MDKPSDQWAKELQELILAEDRKIFSPRVIDNYLKPRNLREISDPHGRSVITGPCGDTMYMGLKIVKDRIVEIGFLTDGCGPTVACGSILTQLALFRTITEVAALDEETLLRALGGLPESHLHCPKLAVDALRQALKNFEDRGGESHAEG
jgi:nitrogen fixation NifU-like protein